MLDSIADIILIDTGAGLADSVMNFVMAADEVILVTTPEPTSITDAYALIKMVSKRDKNKCIKLVVNRAEDNAEAREILNKLTVVSERFLSLKIKSLGYVLQDEYVIKAVKLQRPFMINFPRSQAAKLIREMSLKLIEKENKYKSTGVGIKGFVNKLVGFLSQ